LIRFNNLVFFLLFIATSLSVAQTNLVPNPSFEKLESKPKSVGELTKAVPWISPTDGTADIFSKKSKSDEIGAPKNTLGEQQARTGNNYAGAIFYSKKTNSTREYLQVELSRPLEANKLYCVEFYVSLADLCKYGIDRIGVHFSLDRVGSTNWDPLNLTPQVSNFQGRILTDQSNWEVICGEYKAKGGEKIMTIGNYFMNDQTKIKKVKKPSGIKGSQNEYGYYYIDDVSVIDREEVGTCGCEKKLQIKKFDSGMNYVYSKVSGEKEENVNAEEVIEIKSIFFEESKTDISATAKIDIDMISKLLKDNPKIKIEVIGNAGSNEIVKDEAIALTRATMVYQALIVSGIKKERMQVIKGEPIEIDQNSNEIIKKMNYKVDFSVIID
jgi:outer membrane protein OmpA-like peptidoglycan-associated protein